MAGEEGGSDSDLEGHVTTVDIPSLPHRRCVSTSAVMCGEGQVCGERLSLHCLVGLVAMSVSADLPDDRARGSGVKIYFSCRIYSASRGTCEVEAEMSSCGIYYPDSFFLGCKVRSCQ